MEKIIVNPILAKNTILSSEVASNMEDEGIVLVYDGDKVIGSVVLVRGEWVISILDVQENYSSLEQIISEFPQYTFKYLT